MIQRGYTMRLSIWVQFGVMAIALLAGTTVLAEETSANRLTYLDDVDPYYVSHRFPKLTTPMWVGEPDVDCVVTLSIDDLRTPDHYELFLRPVMERLKKIDGRAPISIFACSLDPNDPQFQRWLNEGLSLEVHTLDHPCPIFVDGSFDKVQKTINGSLDLIASMPNGQPIAVREPCCDVLNSNSPRLYAEIYRQPTERGNFLTMSSTVHHLFTSADPELPRDIAFDEAGHERFLKFIKGDVEILGKMGYQYVNYVANYPYPFIVGGQIWEIACHTPGDHQANFYERHYGKRTATEWKKGVDAAVVKQGLCTLIFHPWGKCTSEELIEVIDHATSQYGDRLKFLNLLEIQQRLDQNLLAGHPLRAANGQDNGVRLLDLNNDGFLDVVIGNERAQITRLWSPETNQWTDSEFPTQIVHVAPDNTRQEAGVRFGILDSDGTPTAIVRNEQLAGAWRFDGEHWVECPDRLAGLELDGQPLLTSERGRDLGVRLRDVDGDGCCELLVSTAEQNAAFAWSKEKSRWSLLPYALPPGTAIVDANGRDAGLRFADTDGDGLDDILFSNDDRYSVHEFAGADRGWSREVIAGKHDESSPFPKIVRGGTNNGAFVHSGRLWVVNEQTGKLPNHAQNVDFSHLHSPPEQSKP